MKCNTVNIIAGVLYHPPELYDRFADEFCRLLTNVYMCLPNSVPVIFGDFNYPSISWDILSVSASDKDAHNFLQTCLNFYLTQLITMPTRSASTTAKFSTSF